MDIGDVRVAVAIPEEFVVHGPALSAPEVAVTKMDWPVTGLPLASLAVTVIVDVLAPFAVTLDGDAVTIESAAVAAPAAPVAVNVTGEPESDPDVAVSVFAPAVSPRVHAGDVAMPSESSVVTVVGVPTEPPPLATANVTDTPATMLP
jgi:hypothetical protein